MRGRLDDFIAEWQFVSLISNDGLANSAKRTGGPMQLAKDGLNIAEYLLSTGNLHQSTFDGIVETLQYILPYARYLQPALTSDPERTVYLQMTEGDFKVPGWLLSREHCASSLSLALTTSDAAPVDCGRRNRELP